SEYLTYVMWAVTPEGRTANLGEVLLNGTKSKLNVTTEMQVFALLITAEPYYAVTRPSDLIVMENVVRTDTIGKVEAIDAKYELLKRGHYQRLSNPLSLKLDKKVPLELYEARNAVQIARAVGADRFATETFGKAEKSLAAAEAYQARNAGVKPVTMTSRESVQMAEDSRAIAVKRQEEQALATERQGSLDREARSESERAAAQAQAARIAREAETAGIQAKEATARAAAQADAAKRNAQAEIDRLQREKNSQNLAAETEAGRLRAEAERLRLENDAKMASAGAEAGRLKLENDAQRAAAQAELDRAVKEKATLRAQLLKQFSIVLQTRDTARGLIVNMSDVLFDTGKFTLRPAAREKLAKVAGIVAGHPGLKLDVEGHTDSVGGDDFNQRLSEQRGGAVRDYLTKGGMAASSVTSKGFGKDQPVASNATASGRQQNRRVEIVVSGDIIGTEIGVTVGNR
ncbi:MAG: OmpA family protein, partial [Candidatus Solibacter sp.]